MAKFRIIAKSVDLMYVDVEAATEEEAREMYEELDGGDFHCGDGYFELNEIEKIDDNAPIDFTADEILRPEQGGDQYV